MGHTFDPIDKDFEHNLQKPNEINHYTTPGGQSEEVCCQVQCLQPELTTL